MRLTLTTQVEKLHLKEPFRLARGVVTEADILSVNVIDEQGIRGRGEALGVPYDGETVATMQAQLQAVAGQLGAGCPIGDLRSLLPRGGARNGLDCALWDLRAKTAGVRVWELLGSSDVGPVTTAVTLGIGDDEDFRRRAQGLRDMPVVKIKVDGARHLRLVEIARDECPDSRLVVDANQSWTRSLLDELAPAMAELGVELIEQPVPVGDDQSLHGYHGPVSLAADESCTDSRSVAGLADLYQYVNIKLDKCGGLSEALDLARVAQAAGLRLMVGNMGGTSLSMAPHFVLAQVCDYVDLDAPLLFQRDREHPMRYEGGTLFPPSALLWG